MTTYRTGTVTVVNGSASVVGLGTSWLSNVGAADIFSVITDNVAYEVSGTPTDDTHITLTAPYGGVSSSGVAYEINRDRTSDGIPLVQRGDEAPFGVLTRAFLKQSQINKANTAFSMFQAGKPASVQTMLRTVVPFSFSIPAGLTNTLVSFSANPTATAVFTLYKNGVSFGTLSISSTGIVTKTAALLTSFTAGTDVLSVVAPSQDATLTDVSIVLSVTKN